MDRGHGAKITFMLLLSVKHPLLQVSLFQKALTIHQGDWDQIASCVGGGVSAAHCEDQWMQVVADSCLDCKTEAWSQEEVRGLMTVWNSLIYCCFTD